MDNNFEDIIDSNFDETSFYMAQINKSFEQTIEEKKKKKAHEKLMDAILSTWIALMFTSFNDNIYSYAQLGIDTADKQLKKLKKDKIVDENINADTFEEQVQNRIDSVQNDFVKLSDTVKSNNSSFFNNFSQSLDKDKTALIKTLKDNGIDFFYDKAGRKWKIENYIKMRTTTELAQSQRLAFFTRATQYGADLVVIRHAGIFNHEACPLCKPFENKVLSINGNTKGYMTIEEATMRGLFHPNCDHYPDELELVNEGDNDINLNKENEKRYKYNKKRGFNFY